MTESLLSRVSFSHGFWMGNDYAGRPLWAASQQLRRAGQHFAVGDVALGFHLEQLSPGAVQVDFYAGQVDFYAARMDFRAARMDFYAVQVDLCAVAGELLRPAVGLSRRADPLSRRADRLLRRADRMATR